jgi:hypothetical protein
MIERILCALFRHRYIVEKRLSESCRKIGCTRCNKKWAMNDEVRAFLPWDSDFENLYKVIKESK